MAHTSTTNQASGAVKTDEVNYFFRDEHGELRERDLVIEIVVKIVPDLLPTPTSERCTSFGME